MSQKLSFNAILVEFPFAQHPDNPKWLQFIQQHFLNAQFFPMWLISHSAKESFLNFVSLMDISKSQALVDHVNLTLKS
jgi:hypothetical protein